MPSSISSSNERCPRGPWLLTWLTGAGLAIVVLAGLELLFRALGHQPSVHDDQANWAFHRHRVYSQNGEKVVVVLGASHILFGFVPSVFEEYFPNCRVVQLALVGRSPMAVLEDLAEDKKFNGTVICSISEGTNVLPHKWKDQQSNVDFYHNHYLRGWPIDEQINQVISARLQNNIVILDPWFKWYKLISHLARERSLNSLVPHRVANINIDRYYAADYTKCDKDIRAKNILDALRASYAQENLLPPEEWLNEAMHIEPYVKKIHDRGGTVLFIRYITTDEHFRLDQKYYPRKEYWDSLAQYTQAHTIHFQDVPALTQFECPDTSHLDRRDAPRFTLELARELDRRGMIHSF
ncbi:MAG: hypothetical protein JW860_00165 [Sedimentisphaerales bacterium]|nr:hypothetical protein [Sedimentisphaerales bacterium]